ncbi:DUF438 domain-containing protein [Oceanobacillus halophilus]|uniref:DUF438 domain-containing protein n=1 Tax=Oceanobacillus halophilus TaxID=930130 RepID=A0A495A734_9BACI|nr:DUF438 domain-containing protein [Oceanobacillus halophilus]RKQ35632.1 DUF438 domain-containing protein [Oceanobacillus halophilus]
MSKAQFNIKLINNLKDILLRLHHGEHPETVQNDFDQHFQNLDAVEILFIVQELTSADDGITSEDVRKLFRVYQQLYGQSITDSYIPESDHPGHPVQIFKDENRALQSVLDQMNNLFDSLEKNQQVGMIERLKEQMSILGQFYNHYNRKEKLFFPIMERYGYYTPARLMWGEDDRIRNLYKGTKRMIEKIPDIEFKYVKKSYDILESKFKEMIFQEESFLLPIVLSIFNEDNWFDIAKESDAFGYCIVEPEEKWEPTQDNSNINKEISAADSESSVEHLAFGGGYLTRKEANHILNNLPLEITFVDKNGIFKYFNDKIESSEMMLVRTPSSIGRNVANCHPPKSLKKVMNLIRDLKTKRRSSESMWFKKKDQYIHITYKGVFDENGEYLGILEYVQDIQPFLELPREVKRELSEIDESN